MFDFDWSPADEAAFELDMTNLGFRLGDDGTMGTVLVDPKGEEHMFADRQDAHGYLQSWYPGYDEDLAEPEPEDDLAAFGYCPSDDARPRGRHQIEGFS